MTPRRATLEIAMVLCMSMPAAAAMNPIHNPADSILNPADNMNNPVTPIYNPGSNSYNPATRKDTTAPPSAPSRPVSQPGITEAAPAPSPVPQPAVHMQKRPQPPRPTTAIPHKKYTFKSVEAYIRAAHNAFYQEDYKAFVAISEDALRRIASGDLKTSMKAKRKLIAYRKIGYELLNDQDASRVEKSR